jgi:hypothetical protein
LSYGIFFGFFEAFREIYIEKKDSWRIAVQEFATLSDHDYLINNWNYITKPLYIILTGSLSGICYQAVNIPLDNIKNVFLLQELRIGRKQDLYFRTFKQCQRLAVKGGGWRPFLYQGFYLSAYRSVPPAALGLFVFERMQTMMGDI